MTPSRIRHSLPLALLTFASLTPSAWAWFECKDILAQGVHFNLEKLGGPYVVHWSRDDNEALERFNYNFTLDICNTLKRHKGSKKSDECTNGSRVCAIRERIDLTGRQNATITPIDIAGTYKSHNGHELDPKFDIIGRSGSNADVGREGVRVELHGGQLKLPAEKKKLDQRAIIEFVCDHDKTGLEGDEKDDGEFDPDKGDDDAEGEQDDGEQKLRKRGDDRIGKCEETEASLKFCGYELEKTGNDKEVQTLRLEWRTKEACANAASDAAGSHWGFFTWFIIILFLAIASYLIFGSWLNYNRYGARGWDLLPHGDTIRDIPYVLKDVARNVVNTVQGPGSRGGYSAV